MKKPKTTYELWGWQCGDGWKELVQPLEAEVIQLGGTISQIKEKFGSLCFFYSLPRAVPKARREELARRVRQAVDLSACTCQRCGKPGSLVSTGGILRTVCEECRALKPQS
jgi:hypothetical protein